MDLFNQNINTIIGQTTEIGKIKKKQLDKKKLENISDRKRFVDESKDTLIPDVKKKDTSIHLIAHHEDMEISSSKKKIKKKKTDEKIVLKDLYKGNFLDLKE